MIILIPLEIGVREIYSKTFLSFFLAKKCKAKVYLFNARSLFKKIKKLKNCIFFDKSLSNTKIEFHQSVMKDNFLVSLDEEGPVYNWDKYVFNGRNPEQVYEKLAGNLLVSSYEKKFFKKKHFNKLFIVGHPKYDLLKKDYISLYEQDGNSLKKKFSNYIYFSSSFSFDTIGGYKNFLLFNKKSFLSGKDGKILYQQFLNFQKNDFINYSLFLETVVEVANRFPKKKIIFRPHPSQDLKDVKKKLKKIPRNLHIIYEGSATQWIKNCEFYIHSHCTTAIEAAILNKKILRIVRNKDTEHARNPIYDNLGYSFSNSDSLIKFIEKNIDNKNTYKFSRNKISKRHVDNFDGKLTCNKIADLFKKKFQKINSILELETNNLSPPKTSLFTEVINFIKRLLKKVVSNYYVYILIDSFYELPRNLLLSREYKKSKMKETNLNDIPKIVNKLNRIVYKKRKKNFVKLKKLNDDIYQLS